MSELTVGRASSNNLVINDPHVSSRHLRMVKHGSSIEVIDQGSSGGTWVNGSRVDRAIIQPGEDLKLSSHYTFNWADPVFTSWFINPQTEPLPNQLLIGRGEDCDLQIFHHSISRNHARLFINHRGLMLEDLSSSGGTAVDGRKITRREIEPGTDVVFSESITLDWEHPALQRWLAINGLKVKRKGMSPLWITATAVAGAAVVVMSTLFATGTINLSGVSDFKEAVTDMNGHVEFTDNTTDEPVHVYIIDSHDDPIHSVEVGFYDQEGFELFVARDPLNRYHPAFEIYPHNSSHTIRMFTNDPGIREIDPNSPEGIAYLATAEYVEENWTFLGQMTAEELDEWNKLHLSILKPFYGSSIEDIYSKAGDVMDYAEKLGLVEKPELYNTFSMVPDGTDDLAGSIWMAIPATWESTPYGEPLITDADLGGRFDPILLPDTAVVFVYAVDQDQIPFNFQRSQLQVQERDGNQWFDVDFNYQFSGDLSSSVNVSFALDYSASMEPLDISRMEDAVVQFIHLMNANDGAEIIKFSSTAQTIQHWNCDRTRVINALLSSWSGEGGMTALYDALYLAVDNPDIDAAIALTDGGENESTRNEQSVRQEAIANNVPIFTIGLGTNCDGNILTRFSNQTGGFYYYSPGSGDLQEIYDKIAGVLENTYRISWKPRTSSTEARVILSLIGQRETMRDTVVVSYESH